MIHLPFAVLVVPTMVPRVQFQDAPGNRWSAVLQVSFHFIVEGGAASHAHLYFLAVGGVRGPVEWEYPHPALSLSTVFPQLFLCTDWLKTR